MSAERFFKQTAAYRTVVRQKNEGRLGHSYLLLCRDEAWVRAYVKALAKLIMCENGGCNECRACRLIDKELYGDCEIYPPEGEKMTSAIVDEMVSEKCHVRPLESSRRVFAIVGAEKMNASSQNKLLKTLEEPPANVHIILGAASDGNILQTVKSRVLRLEIPDFPPSQIYNLLKDEYADGERLKRAVELADGMPGKVAALYGGEGGEDPFDMLLNMKKSREIPRYSAKLSRLTREEFSAYLVLLGVAVRDIILTIEGNGRLAVNCERQAELIELSQKFKEGALLTFSESLDGAIRAFSNNANQTMVADKLLFKLLEENYRWQKL